MYYSMNTSDSFEKHMPSYELNATYILAGILDPRFKFRWSSDDIEKQEFLCLLNTAVDKIMPSTIEQNDDVSSASGPPQKKAKTLFSFMPEHELHIVLPQSQSKTQTEDYLRLLVCQWILIRPTLEGE